MLFSRAANDTTHGVFQTNQLNILSIYSTAVFCKEMKLPSWPTLQQYTAQKRKRS